MADAIRQNSMEKNTRKDNGPSIAMRMKVNRENAIKNNVYQT